MTFYNNAVRRDVVVSDWGGGSIVYYIYKGTDGKTLTSHTVGNVNTSWDAAEWESFGASFSSIATGMLLAENANIAGWIFRNQRLESEDGKTFMDGKTGIISSSDGTYTTTIQDGTITSYKNGATTNKNKVIISAEAEFSNNGTIVDEFGRVRLIGRFGQTSLESDVLRIENLNGSAMGFYSDAAFSVGIGSGIDIEVNTATSKSVVKIKNLPTSSSGLPSGQVWRDGSTLKIVP
jgi:hypothetical protein